MNAVRWVKGTAARSDPVDFVRGIGGLPAEGRASVCHSPYLVYRIVPIVVFVTSISFLRDPPILKVNGLEQNFAQV